jgi:hypothetical protein
MVLCVMTAQMNDSVALRITKGMRRYHSSGKNNQLNAATLK